MKNLSIFKQLLLINLFIITIFIFLFIFKNFTVVQSQIDELEKERIKSIIQNSRPIIAINMSLELADGYIEIINNLIENNKEFLMVKIEDKFSNTLYSKSQKYFDNSKISTYKSIKIDIRSKFSDNFLGSVTFYYTFSSKYKEISRGYQEFLFFIFLVFIISLSISLFFIKKSLKRLNTIKGYMRRYKLGKEIEIDLMQGDSEISIINNAIVDMLNRVDLEIKKRLDYEERLLHNSRLSAMGEMLENIAHQWRQPLMQINSILLNMDRKLELDNLDKDYFSQKISEVEDVVLYMSQTIEDFKSFLNPKKNLDRFNLINTLNDIFSILKDSLNSINLDLEVEELDIYGYKNEFKQVILSILNNSIDIFKVKDIKDRAIYIRAKESKDKIYISIEDNAGGIDNSIIDKIFEPYFTTKHKSGGTGLGLYISKLIVEGSMGGKLSVKNGNFGAKFTITLKKESL